jgi:hypothetical protein
MLTANLFIFNYIIIAALQKAILAKQEKDAKKPKPKSNPKKNKMYK